MKNHPTLRKFAIGLGAVSAALALLVMQRDYIYGNKGNMGQGTHPRF